MNLARKGRSPTEFIITFARLAARAVLSGRRLCGGERARDVLSPVCQRRRGFCVSSLPAGTAMVGNVFDEALVHDTQTPLPDQGRTVGVTATNLAVMLHRARLRLWRCLTVNCFGEESVVPPEGRP